MSADIIKFPATDEENELVHLHLDVPRWLAETILEVIEDFNEAHAR